MCLPPWGKVPEAPTEGRWGAALPTEPICRAAVVYLPLIRPCGATFSLGEKANE